MKFTKNNNNLVISCQLSVISFQFSENSENSENSDWLVFQDKKNISGWFLRHKNTRDRSFEAGLNANCTNFTNYAKI